MSDEPRIEYVEARRVLLDVLSALREQLDAVVQLYWLQRKQLFWPSHMGGGPVVHPTSGAQFETTQQKAVDVGLAFHLMKSFARKGWPKLFLGAGDGDFHEVVQHLVENENVSVFLIGTMNSISEELRPYATGIVELGKIATTIARPRPAPPPGASTV